MNKPCDHCDKADNRAGFFKCDNPCRQAKQCHENNKKLLDILSGKKVHEVMEK